jgi:hypothetical protein
MGMAHAACLPLKAASAFMFFLVQSAHLVRPTTTEATWPSAAYATVTAISTAQTPRSILPDAMVLLASLCVRRSALRHGFYRHERTAHICSACISLEDGAPVL